MSDFKRKHGKAPAVAVARQCDQTTVYTPSSASPPPAVNELVLRSGNEGLLLGFIFV